MEGIVRHDKRRLSTSELAQCFCLDELIKLLGVVLGDSAANSCS